MNWLSLRELMVGEPKPPLACVVEQRRDDTVVRSARVLHDGSTRWLIWSGDKLEFCDGTRTVLCSRSQVEAFDSMEVYSHGWIKSLIHPHLMNAGRPAPASNSDAIEASAVGEAECWRVDVDGLRDGEDVTFTLDVDQRSGIVVQVTRASSGMKLTEIEWNPDIPDAVFTWRGPVDVAHERVST